MNKAFFFTQRQLRQKRLNALKKGILGLIDLGSSKVSCFILSFSIEEKDKGIEKNIFMPKNVAFRVIGVATTKSRGINCGEIISMEEVEKAIRTVVSASQKMGGVIVEDVMVSFSCSDLSSYNLIGKSEIETSEITEKDIGNALSNCNYQESFTDKEIIHAIPVNFTIDERSGFTDPLGQTGSLLEVDLHLISVKKRTLQNIIHCIKRCQLELSGVVSSSYVSGISSLVEDELLNGAACVDLGCHSTGITIFLNRQLVFADEINLGGENITRDISKAFKISLGISERIKNLHGGVIANNMDDREIVDVTNSWFENSYDRMTITRSELIGVMRPRVEEILEFVKTKLKKANFYNLENRKVIITGGTSQIPGLFDVSEKILNSSVRVGRPLRLQGLPHATNGPEFSSIIGLALYACHPNDECWDFRMPSDEYPLGKFNNVFKWFLKNW